MGLSIHSTIADVTAPLTPKLSSIVPENLNTLVKAGFDIPEQLLSTERKLTEAAAAIVVRGRLTFQSSLRGCVPFVARRSVRTYTQCWGDR